MKILVTGSGSQLTEPFARAAGPRGHDLTSLTHAELDIRDVDAVRKAADGFDAIVNFAAANAVDACEQDPILAYEGNMYGPLCLARAATDVDATLVHFSTDFVHGGLDDPPAYLDEDVEAKPVNVYGHSKLMGEEAVLLASTRHYVLRTSWVIGDRFLDFIRTKIDAGEFPLPPTGHACPAVAQDLVAVVVRLLEENRPYGRYNVVNPPAVDRPILTRALVEALGGDPDIVVLGEDTRPAPRPEHSPLAIDKLAAIGIEMPPWRDSVQAFIAGEPSALL